MTSIELAIYILKTPQLKLKKGGSAQEEVNIIGRYSYGGQSELHCCKYIRYKISIRLISKDQFYEIGRGTRRKNF